MAVWLPQKPIVTFGDLQDIAGRVQNVCLEHKIGPGDSILLIDTLGPRLYGTIIGLLALGISIILVEPWMPVKKINHVINTVKPKAFLSPLIGQLWGLRVGAVRQIPHWIRSHKINQASLKGSLTLESVNPETPGIITFTSGTTGNPKGVVRNQGYMVNQHEVLSKNLGESHFKGPDLCIFANFVLLNLASGRGTVLVPPKWKAKHLNALNDLPTEFKPESMTCGPAFLQRLMCEAPVQSLKSIHVGGALTDIETLESGFKAWPNAHWTHIYGSSEAEPVALADARKAVEESKKRGLHQTLYLGKPIDELLYDNGPDGLWIAGPHVCPQYVGSEEENKLYKRRDDKGRVWHFMGDRVVIDDVGWWYGGRSGQTPEEFKLEQGLYSKLGHSKLFVKSDNSGKVTVCGENVKTREQEIRQSFPQVARVVELKIYRDPRHRARIDRGLSLRKGAPWLVG